MIEKFQAPVDTTQGYRGGVRPDPASDAKSDATGLCRAVLRRALLRNSLLFEFLRYAVVGGVAFVADFGTLWLTRELLFKSLSCGVYLATACGFFVGLAVNYALSLAFVFTQAKDQGRGRSVGAGIALFALFQIAGGLIASSGFFADGRFGCDLQLRRNEICCAHQGVNSFRIWTRETTLPGFTPITRPDMEDLPRAPGDAVVHAYTPWHTAMFYFYGWLPEQMCLSLMSVVFGLCLFFIVYECVRIAKTHFEHYGLAVGLSLSIISYFVAQCFVFLNYGVLVLAAFFLMNRMFEKGHDVVAGLCWAVMMIKPQVGLLFVWPLFWHRHYRTIVTATVACLVATFLTSLQVHESMIDLILQVPQIGKPYGTGGLVDRILGLAIGKSCPFVGMLFFFLMTGLSTWALRRNREFIVSCVPVVVVIPLWTYGQEHDHVILVIALLVLAGRMFAAGKFNKWAVLGIVYFLSIFFIHLWRMAVHFHLFDPTGLSKIYSLVELASQMSIVAVAALLIREEWQRWHRGTAGFL